MAVTHKILMALLKCKICKKGFVANHFHIIQLEVIVDIGELCSQRVISQPTISNGGKIGARSD